MGRKEYLCDWFKALSANKRVDYMCGLLRMCLPLELRFIGTVLEDLAKKDFHILRDQEIKANQRTDLSSNNPGSLSDKKLRAKMMTALALLNSTNSPCAEIIFEILQQDFGNIIGLVHNNTSVTTDVCMILTLAVHHPAFSFYQRNQLGQVLERVEAYIQQSYGDDIDDWSGQIIQSHTPEFLHSSVGSSQPYGPLSEKVAVVKVQVLDVEICQNRKDHPDYRIHMTWSNGEVTEILLKYKQLQDLHSKVLHRFTELKKHMSCLVFPGKCQQEGEPTSDHISSLNIYFNQLMTAPSHVHGSDIVTEFLRNGTLTFQHKPVTLPTYHPQPLIFQAGLIREDLRHDVSPYHQAILMPPYPNVVSYAHGSSEQSQMSSTTSSPASSRTSSPSPLPFHADSKSNMATSGAVKANNVTVSGVGILHPAPFADQNYQLLHFLNLEKYYEELKDYPFHQVFHMSKEELAKTGLPVEVQAKIASSLSQIRLADMNSMFEANRPTLTEAYATYYPPHYHYSFAHINHPYLQHFIHPAAYAAQSGQVTLLPSPQLHPKPHDSSSTSSDTSSPPPALPLDHGQKMSISRHQMTSPPSAPAADLLLSNNVQADPADSSGSDDERLSGYSQKPGMSKNNRHTKPQHSQSFPLVSQGTSSLSAAEAANLTGMLICMSATHGHPTVLTATDLRTARAATPPALTISANPAGGASSHISVTPVNVVNGHLPDPSQAAPPQGSSLVDPRAIMSSRTYQAAHPTQSNIGVYNNLMAIPTLDISHPFQSLGTSSLPVFHGSLPHPSYNIPMNPSIPSTHVMGLNPVNFQTQTPLQLGSQPPSGSSLIPESRTYSRYLMSHPRGILTTIANSTAVMVTTQSHQSRPSMSHSSSHASNKGCNDQVQTTPYIADTGDSIRAEETSLTASHGSDTSSPPFASVSHKQTNEARVSGRASQVVGFINGYGPQIIHQQGHHPPQQTFPNGVTSDYNTWLRLPLHIAPSYIPFMYGSVYPPHSPAGTPQTTVSSCSTTSTTTTTNQSQGGGNVSGKSKCYNCGHVGHEVSDCKESRMDTMSNSFHLKYSPSDPPV